MSYETELLEKAYAREAEVRQRASVREEELRNQLRDARAEVSRLKWDIARDQMRRRLNRQWAFCVVIVIAWMVFLSVAFGFFVSEVR